MEGESLGQVLRIVDLGLGSVDNCVSESVRLGLKDTALPPSAPKLKGMSTSRTAMRDLVLACSQHSVDTSEHSAVLGS